MVVVYNNDQELLEEANKEREGMAKESKAITAADKSKDKLRTRYVRRGTQKLKLVLLAGQTDDSDLLNIALG